MAKETFIEKKFNDRHLAIIQRADKIMSEYGQQGYDLSLRQLYYQFVAHHNLPNTEQSYKSLGTIISDGRLAGLLDWNALVDRGRQTYHNTHWDSPADQIEANAKKYNIDLWENQRYHVELMVEKQALEGVLWPVCARLDVPFTANKGYSSSSALYEAGKRIEQQIDYGKRVVIIYLGDHDPSGIDMTRDVRERLRLFSWADDDQVEVERIALNMNQVREYNPPPNPAKMTDSRADGYVAQFGRQSWELDALNPTTLANLATEAIEQYIDQDQWEIKLRERREGREFLQKTAEEYRKQQNARDAEREDED
jgi:hypothetical protein